METKPILDWGPIDWPFSSRDDVKIYLIHVGKAGGISLRKRLETTSLKAKLNCYINATTENDSEACHELERQSVHNMSAVRTHLYGHCHIMNVLFSLRQRQWLKENTNLLLFTVRDPVDRLVSAFNYHHYLAFHSGRRIRGEAKVKKVYNVCFPDVQHLAMSQSILNGKNFSEDCRILGRSLLTGDPLNNQPRRPAFAHFTFNYQYYVESVWDDRVKSVAVIRTESQWSDTARLESLLGGNPKVFSDDGNKYSHGSENFTLTSGVTREGAELLCCVIYKDIQVYHDLIVASVNLNADDKLETLNRLFDRCSVTRKQEIKSAMTFQWDDWYDTRCPSIVWRQRETHR